jgi:ubiquinone/menaquinone biosynthesis C-methylase UbiE
MRRQVVPPITRFAQERGADEGKGLRALDVACGTGRTLAQLHAALPKLRLAGVDLSPFYAHEARTLLRHLPEVSIAAENGEELPFRDGWFDVITSTYLFHELPRNARRNVVHELFRVVRPGGLVVIEDSAQPAESPELEGVLRQFPREFHEPFYADYLEDDLAGILAAQGFDVTAVEPHLVAKVVIARRP